MVSIGPNTQSYNFTYKFTLPVKDVNLTEKYTPGSMMYFIDKNPDFSKFKKIILVARMDTILDNLQANFTLFVPSDKSLKCVNDTLFHNMNITTARHIVKNIYVEKENTL